jgi:hypothetical protein
MPDFDTRTRQEPDEPNQPRSLSIADRVGNRQIAILRLVPIASYALAQIIVVGFWAYRVSEYGVDLHPEHDEHMGLLGAFLYTAIPIVPLALVLGAIDAAARRSSRPLVQALLLVVDALLIVLFALVWIVHIEYSLLRIYGSCVAEYACERITRSWPEYIGVLIGAELGLVVLMVVSVTIQLIVRRSRRGGS